MTRVLGGLIVITLDKSPLLQISYTKVLVARKGLAIIWVFYSIYLKSKTYKSHIHSAGPSPALALRQAKV
jgi:hypothetical protein